MPLKGLVVSSRLRVSGNVLIGKKNTRLKECLPCKILLENGDCLIANLLLESCGAC